MASSHPSKPPLFRIGMLGGGTVGGGVYQRLMEHSASTGVVVTKLCVRDVTKARDFVLDTQETQLVTDPTLLLGDDVDCVVEVAGGSTGIVAQTVLDALKGGKPVITANKALLAERLLDVQDAILNSKSTARLGYEAAVCGGIPIIATLATAYTGDRISRVAGIANGTTNFMLSAMAADASVQYADILQQAQDLGYAEADPTADVEGHDVRAKLCLLAKLAFGTHVPVADVTCTGITRITAADFVLLKDSTIKLVGTAERVSETTACVYVTPAAVPRSHPLASIDGSGNCVVVTSQNMGDCSYSGPGAGRFPTANSIVADVYRAAAQQLPPAFAMPLTGSASLTLVDDYTAAFYVRVVLLKASSSDDDSWVHDMAAPNDVTIASTATHTSNDGTVYMAVWTTKCARSAADTWSRDCLLAHDLVDGNTAPLVMPLLD